MTARLAERLSRLEQALARDSGTGPAIPPGLASALMYGVAVHLGGFPAPGSTEPRTLTAGDALALALGYGSDEDLQALVGQSDEWIVRFESIIPRLLDLLGLNARQAGQNASFQALTRLLDEYAAAKTGGDLDGWSPPAVPASETVH